jgi:hypothetical protein
LFEATPAKRELFISIQAKGFRNEAYILGLGIEIQSLSGDQNEQVTLAVSRACRNLVGQHGYAVYRYTSKENGVGSKAWNSMILGKPSGEWLDRTGFFPTENELPKQISIAKIVRIITNALRTTIENPEEEFILPSVILNRRTRLRRRLRRLKRVIWRRKTEE